MERRYRVGITAKTIRAVEKLGQYGLDLKRSTAKKKSDDSGFSVSGILSDEQIKELRSSNYVVQIHSDLTKESTKRLQEVSKVNRFENTNQFDEIKEKVDLPTYLNTAEIETVLIKLKGLFPNITELIQLPNPTYEGRLSNAIRVRAGLPLSKCKLDRVGVMFIGSMHAREWGGSDICINFLVKLLSSYINNTSLIYGENSFSSEQIRTLLENVDLFVFPDVNPDGKVYSQAHDDTTPLSLDDQDKMWWRKNHNPVEVINGDDPNHSTGVDVNHNFNFLWGSGIGTLSEDHSGRTHSLNYPGVVAFSEPESSNVKYLFDEYKNIRYFVDIHSCGEMILYNWGDDTNQSDDSSKNFLNDEYKKVRGKTRGKYADDYKEFIKKDDLNVAKQLAISMNDALKKVFGSSYKVQQSAGLYTTSGTSDDYAYSRHIAIKNAQKIYGFTIEFPSDELGFIPPISEMQKIIKEISSAMTEFCISAYQNEIGSSNSKSELLIEDT
jgi:murein tripeptide amidase MpaA